MHPGHVRCSPSFCTATTRIVLRTRRNSIPGRTDQQRLWPVGGVETDPRHAKARSALLEGYPFAPLRPLLPWPVWPLRPSEPLLLSAPSVPSISNSKSCFLDMLVMIEFVNAEGEASGVHPTLPKAGICRLELPAAASTPAFNLRSCVARPEQRLFSEMCPLIRCLGVAGRAGTILICGSRGSPTSTDIPGCDL